MEKGKYESGLYLALAENISGIETDRIKQRLPIVVHYVDGKLVEFYTDKEVYRGDNYLDRDFLESNCMLYTDSRIPFESLSRAYVINQVNFQPNIVTSEIIPDIEKLAELTKEVKDSQVKTLRK